MAGRKNQSATTNEAKVRPSSNGPKPDGKTGHEAEIGTSGYSRVFNQRGRQDSIPDSVEPSKTTRTHRMRELAAGDGRENVTINLY